MVGVARRNVDKNDRKHVLLGRNSAYIYKKKKRLKRSSKKIVKVFPVKNQVRVLCVCDY